MISTAKRASRLFSPILLGLLALALPSKAALGNILTFTDLSAFNTAAGTPPITMSFDSIPAGTNLAGMTLNGITFTSPSGNSLDVVAGADTFTNAGDFSGVIDASTNVLSPTSGANVLSPGGTELVPGPGLGQEDSLQLDFANPVKAFGIHVIFQSLDPDSFTTYVLFDSTFAQIADGTIMTGGFDGGPGGAAFLGFVSDMPSTDISRIVINDADRNDILPDANIGFDTIRISQVPEPSPLLLMGAVFAWLALRRRS